jgi:hypothetical protein
LVLEEGSNPAILFDNAGGAALPKLGDKNVFVVGGWPEEEREHLS